MLRHAMDVIEAWGFTYKTVAFYWVKLNKGRGGIFLSPRDFFTGMGFWTRANPELCLLATRGKPQRRATNVAKLLIEAAARAFPQARRDLRPHRAPGRRPLSRAVRARLPARLGPAGQPGRPVRPGAGAHPAPPIARPGPGGRGLTRSRPPAAPNRPPGRIVGTLAGLPAARTR